MNFSQIKKNPIFLLAMSVVNNLVLLEDALFRAGEQNFIAGVDITHLEQIVEFIGNSTYENLDIAALLSEINLYCAKAKRVSPELWAIVNLSHGKILDKQNIFNKALENFNIARNIFVTHEMEYHQAICDISIGNIFLKIGEFERCFGPFEKAKKFFQKAGMRDALGQCTMNLATVYRELDQFGKSIEHYDYAKKIFDDMNMKEDAANCDLNVAGLWYDLGRYDKALSFNESAEAFFSNYKMESDVALCLMNKAMIYRQLGQVELSLENYQSAKKVFIDKGMKIEVADCDLNLASLYFDLGMYEKAVKYYEIAKKIYDERGMEGDSAKCKMNVATVYQELGEYELSLALYEAAREFFARSEQDADIAVCDMNIASLNLHFGQYGKSLNLYKGARNIFHENGRIVDCARCDRSIGNLFENVGEYERSIKFYELARGVFGSKGMELELARCERDMANVYLELGQLDKVMPLYESAKKIFHQNKMEIDVAKLQSYIADMCLEQCDYDRALKLYRSTRDFFVRKHMPKQVDESDLNLAHAYILLGKYGKAQSILEGMGEYHGHSLGLNWRRLFLIGRTCELKGNLDNAERAYRQTVDVIESMWKEIPQEGLRNSFFGSVYNVYRKMVQVLIDKNDFESALEYVERAKSRNLAELLAHRSMTPRFATKKEKTAFKKMQFDLKACITKLNKMWDKETDSDLRKELSELKRKYKEMVTKFKKSDPDFDPDFRESISYSGIKSLVNDHETALVELFPTMDKTIAFIVLFGKKLKESTVFINYTLSDLKNDIDQLLKRYDAFIRKNESSKRIKTKKLWEDYLESVLKKLHAKLFVEIQEFLKGCTRITFIPYSGFHLLPLHAMFTEVDGRRQYIIDEYIVNYAPSARILKQCQKRSRTKKEKVLIVLANPKDTDALPYARKEVESISKLFETPTLILEATRREILDHGKKANVFHYGGHAHFKALILHKENEKERRDELWVDDIFANLDLPLAYIATLSACETGITEIGKIDEYIGIPSAFLYAGTPTVVSSLWSVEDRSTSLLMQKMYEVLKESEWQTGKAEALVEAQRWLKNRDNRTEILSKLSSSDDISWVGTKPPSPPEVPDFSRPYYWAGFVCSGAD